MGQTATAPREAAQRVTLDVEQRVTETVGRWSASLLRTARRHSICDQDAEDAYQRTLEIYLRHVERLDHDRVHLWLHTVAKREAMAVREKRLRHLAPDDVDLERLEARHVPSPEDSAIDFERLERAAEALAALKPAEVRALWLQAHGLSYKEIASATDWTYTKVNRALTEGRRSFLRHYNGLEAGEGCTAFDGALGRVAAGEVRAGQVPGLRAHLRHCGWCRAGLRRHRTPAALSVLLPAAGVPVLAGDGAAPREAATHALVRLVEAAVAQVQERAAGAVVRTHAAVETAVAGGGKAAAAAASAAALAGGGVVAAEEVRQRASAAPTSAAAGAGGAGGPAAAEPVRFALPGARAVSPVTAASAAAAAVRRPGRRGAATPARSAAGRDADARRRLGARRAARAEFAGRDGDPGGGRERREFGTSAADGGGGGAAAISPASAAGAPASGPASAAAPVTAPAAAPAPAPAPAAPSGSFESAGGGGTTGEFGG